MVTHQLKVWCRPVKVRRSETDVLPLVRRVIQPTAVQQPVAAWLLLYPLTLVLAYSLDKNNFYLSYMVLAYRPAAGYG